MYLKVTWIYYHYLCIFACEHPWIKLLSNENRSSLDWWEASCMTPVEGPPRACDAHLDLWSMNSLFLEWQGIDVIDNGAVWGWRRAWLGRVSNLRFAGIGVELSHFGEQFECTHLGLKLMKTSIASVALCPPQQGLIVWPLLSIHFQNEALFDFVQNNRETERLREQALGPRV